MENLFFVIVSMDHYGSFFICVQEVSFSISYATRMFILCVHIIHLLFTWIVAVLAFYFSTSSGRARREGERDEVSSLLTSTCHRGSLCVCSLPQVARSHLMNPPLKKKLYKKHFNRLLLSFSCLPTFLFSQQAGG